METNEWTEIIKSIMYADDIDWDMSLVDDSIKYSKSYQLHSKIKDVVSKHFIPISELKRWVEENKQKDCKCGVFCDCNLEARDAHNSALKALKDKFIKE